MMIYANLGDTYWTIENDEVIPITVDFIGDHVVISKQEDGSFLEKKYSELFKTEEEAKAYINSKKIVVLCREINRKTGEVIVYRLPGTMENFSVMALKIRSRYNPELQYFFTLENNDLDEIMSVMLDADACEELSQNNIIVKA